MSSFSAASEICVISYRLYRPWLDAFHWRLLKRALTRFISLAPAHVSQLPVGWLGWRWLGGHATSIQLRFISLAPAHVSELPVGVTCRWPWGHDPTTTLKSLVANGVTRKPCLYHMVGTSNIRVHTPLKKLQRMLKSGDWSQKNSFFDFNSTSAPNQIKRRSDGLTQSFQFGLR